MKRLYLFVVALIIIVSQSKAQETTTIAQWQFTASWYFGLLPDYEVIQPIRLIDTKGNDVTSDCLGDVEFTTSAETSISVDRVPAGHNSGMTGYWKLKAGQTVGNATITASYTGQVQWNQAAVTPFTVFCGDPTNSSWLQNNMFGIDPLLVYASAGDIVQMPTITVNGNRNVLTDFDILYVRSSNKDNVEVIEPAYNNAGVLLHGYQFRVKNTKATRIWIEIKGKGQFVGYWAKIYFNINGLTVSHGGAVNGQAGQGSGDADEDPNADPIVTPEGETPSAPAATYAVKIPVQNYVLAAGQTIHQTPAVLKTEKNGEELTTTDVSDHYTFAYTCDRPEYAYIANDGTVTALQEIKEPLYINVKATPKNTAPAECKEVSASYSVQIYSSESVIRLNPAELTIPMASATVGESRLVPSIIMKVNGVVYEPNLENTYDLSYEGFNPSIVTLVDEDGKLQNAGQGFDMKKVKSFKALKPGTTQGIVHAKGKGMNSGFWGTAPFTITVKPYVAPVNPGTPTPEQTGIREISIPVHLYTMAHGNTIRQRIKVKEFATAEDQENNIYTDVTDQYTLAYTSSNTQIATVDETGLVTAQAENVNPAYITVTATPVSNEVPTVNAATYGVKIFGGASVISPSRKNITVAPSEMVPAPGVNVVVDGIQYSTENAFNLHYEISQNADVAEIITNSNIRGLKNGNATVTVKVIGKGEFEGFYGTTEFEVIVRQSETLDGANTWYWAQDGARSAIYDLYPGKQLHFELTNKTLDTSKSDAGWTFVASKTPGYSDQAFLAANPMANLMTWDGWGENANPQPVITLPEGTFDLNQYKSDLANAKVDYIVALAADGKTLSVHATIEARDVEGNTVRTYHYDIENKQLSYQVNMLPVYFSSVRSTIESLRLIPHTYTVTVGANEGGSVKVKVNGVDAQQAGRSFTHTVNDIEEGSRVTVMALPNAADAEHARYYFVNWTEDKSTSVSRDFYIDHDITLTANFHQDENKWLKVTQDGQVYELIKANYDNDYYFKVKYGEEVHFPEEKWDLIPSLQQTLTTLYSHDAGNGVNDHHIDLYVRGAKAFRIYAFDTNGVESKYTVTVDGGEAQTVAHHGTALETSQLFSIASPVAVDAESEGFNTISLKGNDNQLYPYMVVFYTKEPIQQTANRLYATLADNKPVEIAASTLASAGTLSSVTYNNNKDKDIATAEVIDGKLVITGKKAGNIMVKLNFAGDETHSSASFDYTIIVKKRDVRLSWNKKSINLHINGQQPQQQKRLAAQDWSQLAVLHYTEYDINGDTIHDADRVAPEGVSVSFVSTNPELLNYDNGSYTFAGTEGTTDLIAQLSEDDQFMNNSASVCINITSRNGIYYEVDKREEEDITNGMLKDLEHDGAVLVNLDMHVYKYNDKLSEIPADGKVVKETKDQWGEVKEYQGSDAMKKVWYVDGFSYTTQGNQNAMSEKFRSNDGKDWRISWTSDDYSSIHPFSLPVRGSFVKFEAVKTGTLTAYVLQNGNFNFNHISEYESKKDKPIAENPRLYYWFDQEGKNLQPQVEAETLQPLAIGRRDDLPKLTEMLTKEGSGYDDQAILQMYREFPSQWDVDRNLEKAEPKAQPIIEYHGGYSIMNKAYMKYQLPVKAGNTYYFFSNDSKVAFAGVTFKPETPASARQAAPAKATLTDGTLALSESDDWSSEDMRQHLGQTFGQITLARKFTKNQWNTICLPFNVSEKQVEDVFGVGTQLIIYDGIKEVEGKRIAQFLRHVDQNILAGQPYFIYATGVDKDGNDLLSVSNGAISSLTFTDVTIPGDLQVRSYGHDDEDGLRMVGTLSKTKVAKYDYYVNANTGLIMRYTGNGTTLNTYRAFLQQTHPAQARSFDFGYTDIESEADGTATGLEQVIQDLGITENIHMGTYTLDGRSTQGTIHGIQIVNGKKVLK